MKNIPLIYSNDPDTCLKTVIVAIVYLLQVSLKKADVRNIRILVKKQANPNQDSNPPTFIVTFYSSSDCLKILDAKKIQRKVIRNKDLIQGSNSNTPIFIKKVLGPEIYKLLIALIAQSVARSLFNL